MTVPARLRAARKGSPVWFWRPQWWWGGPHALQPVWIGHDEYSRRTLCIGLPITGRVIVALWYCGSADCYAESLRWLEDEEDAS